ncbi:hypothetical protein D9Q98_001564 [Chlorella vulgaris]|uniref:Putative gamma-glutamylcyclotransferase n=1 Tax=Chlorella vulgaris TaxID=3077 RepID=A0A9D4TUN7_CHLVU|nr:hypothetical protein D9Q98_001564 [Chlorella vulgaris]
MTVLFVYGTLMFPEVLKALLAGRVPRHAPAQINGFQRYRIKNQVFPGTVKAAQSQVQGLCLFDLQQDELQVLDEFEGDEYYKEEVEAQLLDGGTTTATVYLWQDSLRSYLYGAGGWDPEAFREKELEAYVEMCGRFAADVRQQRDWKGEFPLSE